MGTAENTELIDRFEEFYRNYCRNEIGELAQKYPNDRKSLYIDWDDLYRFDPDLADDYRTKPGQLQEFAEEALRLYDLPVDVSLGQAHVRVRNLPDAEDIRSIRHEHHGNLIAVRGIVRKATDVRPKVTEAAFECQRCGTLSRIPQTAGDFQEPHECQGCERQGPFRLNTDRSQFIDAQKIRVQESPEGLRGGETPQSIDVNVEDDITGTVTAGDHVRVTGILKLDQQGSDQDKSPMFDIYMEGVTVVIEDEQFEDMEITDADKKEIVELSNEPDVYDRMVGAIAPSIYGYEKEKLAMMLQLFSGVSKDLPDGSRIRGDLHMLLIGDPGTGKCVSGETLIRRADGTEIPIRALVESNLDDPKPVDDGVWDAVDFEVPSVQDDGTIAHQRATKVWKREAPDQLYRIRTSTGREITVTPSHPLFVQSDGQFRPTTADSLSEGTFVAVPTQLPAEGTNEPDVIPDISAELRRIRAGLGLAQSACGLPRSTYNHYEHGRGNPGRESLRAVVTAFQSRLAGMDDRPATGDRAVGDGGGLETLRRDVAALSALVDGDIGWDRIDTIETVEPDGEWVYDLEVAGTHNYLSNGIVSHNSQMLSYIQNIAPRSVYTSGKGSSSAGLTAAAVRDDFGDGQQWTLEAGALVLADQGIAAVDELDKMSCVTGETLVQGADGIARIRDLAHDAAETGTIESLSNGRTIREFGDLRVWTMTDDGRIVTRPVTAIHEYDAPDELTRVTLRTGERLTATADHPFFVRENGERSERPAAALDAGDWVYVPDELRDSATDGGVSVAASTETDSLPRHGAVSPALAAVLGYLAGDGNVYYDRDEGVYGIRFTNAEEELLADFETACRRAFDTEPVRPPSEQRADGVETVRVSGKPYADTVLDAGMNLETYDGKRLPESVTQSSRAAKTAFLRALADSEGSVDDRNVRIHSSSYGLLLGAKQLLVEFGVSTQLRTRERSDRRDIHVLTVTDADSLAAFDRHVGFTLDRKQRALEEAVERVSGDRTILDVIPSCGDLLTRCRESLRLYQSECGLDGVTYCNFENEDANISLRCAQSVLGAFETRVHEAADDGERLGGADWDTLERIRERYHVSQRELAEDTDYTQPQLSRLWGTDADLRDAVERRLSTIVGDVAETDLESFRALVHGDVKWRRVDSVETVEASVDDDRIRLLREELAGLLDCSPSVAVERASALLDSDPAITDWDSVEAVADRYGVAYATLADDVGVAPSTVSRWVRGVVDTDRSEDVRTALDRRVATIREQLSRRLAEIESRATPSVYDLTVAGTHNFLANGMVVHNSEDRSAMHEALEQQRISISKAGINATLKSRCSLLGAANPKYGRFDQYEPIGEQIDLEPALISRFDLIFTVTDKPDEEKDRNLAEHIIQTNYAGELHTHRTNNPTSNFTEEEVDTVTDEVAPTIEPDLLRKYIAYAKRNCYPTMTEEAKSTIEEFYVDLRMKGQDEDAPVPVTARKLEALVRLAEASARIRLSDTVDEADADRAVDIAHYCLKEIGVDPETGEFDADVVETGQSKSQRDRIKDIKQIVADIEAEYDEGAPVDVIIERAEEVGIEESKAEHEIEKLKTKGELYEPTMDHLRTT